jgi:hypothetical protein
MNQSTTQRRAPLAVLLLLAGLWLSFTARSLTEGGLFNWPGVEWRVFWAAAKALTPGDPSRVYDPESMISWRGLILSFFPGLSDSAVLVTTVALSLGTVLLLVPLWRGEWAPRTSRFAAQLLGTGIISLLASYHSHTYGAAMLLTPSLMLAALGTRGHRSVLYVASAAPSFVFLAVPVISASTVLIVALVALLGACLLHVRRGPSMAPEPENASGTLIA